MVVDYASSDMDVAGALKASPLTTKYVRASGAFRCGRVAALRRALDAFAWCSRAGGLQLGADAVADPESVLLFYDLHLDTPHNMIELARRFTVRRRSPPRVTERAAAAAPMFSRARTPASARQVRGKASWMPILVRLDDGATPTAPRGKWEKVGYGIMTVHARDHRRIGGFDTKTYTTTWGGEDEDMLGRVVGNGLDANRMCVSGLYHHYHKALPWRTGAKF